MSEIKVLLLGWELLPAVKDGNRQQTPCYTMAKALGDQVDLSLILPVADQDLLLQNVTLSSLNKVDLMTIAPSGPRKDIQPFAQGEYIRTEIPLYGAPLHPESQYGLSGAEPGQAASAGFLQRLQEGSQVTGGLENQNFFSQQHSGQVSLDTQIIQYARWATRWAAHQQFNVIYAFDWQTFLAGNELKLVSEKPLALQVQSLSQDREGPDSHGWMYQVEMQALQRADCIIAASDNLASILEDKYHISAGIINSLEENKVGAAPEGEDLAGAALAAGLSNVVGIGEEHERLSRQHTSQEEAAGARERETAKKVREILQQIAA